MVTVDAEGAYLAKAAAKNIVKFSGLYFGSDQINTDADMQNDIAPFSLAMDAGDETDYKEEVLLEGIHHRLLPMLRA